MKKEVKKLINDINTSWTVYNESCSRLLELVFPIFSKLVDQNRLLEAKAIFDKMPDSVVRAYLADYLRETGKSFNGMY